MLYGADAPTWVYHSIAGVTLEDVIVNGQLDATVADASDIVLIELGVNDRFNVVHGHPAPTRSYIAGIAGTIISTIKTPNPKCQIGWLLPLVGGGEQWNPPADDATMTGIVQGIQDACVTYNVQAIDLHTLFLAAEQILNPGQQNGGVLTFEGTHPNWRGRPLMGRGVIDRVMFTNPNRAVDVDKDLTWTPDRDVTPTVYVDADLCTPGPLTTIGVGAHPFTKFPGYTGATCVAGGWFDGGNAIRFNGTTDVLTSNLVTPAGPKTIFALFKVTDVPPNWNTWYSLLTLTNGVVTSEVIPYATSSWGPLSVMCDEKASGSDGAFVVYCTVAFSGDVGYGYPVRFASIFAGGSSTDVTQYDYRIGGWPLDSPASRGVAFTAQALTCLCALGARVEDGVTPTMFAKLDLKVLLAYSGILTAQQFYRIDQWMRRKGGP
jgi:lysophospholipase L1-like esterase